MRGDIVGGLRYAFLWSFNYLYQIFFLRNYWGLKRHFPDLADAIYAAVDPSVQKALDREQDLLASNGTGSMSASLRGSNSSLNSMPGSVISRCCLLLRFL